MLRRYPAKIVACLCLFFLVFMGLGSAIAPAARKPPKREPVASESSDFRKNKGRTADGQGESAQPTDGLEQESQPAASNRGAGETGALPETGGENEAAVERQALEVLRIDETWTMRDGVELPVSVFYPAGKGEGDASKYPLIIFVHPWNCEKTFFEGTAMDYALRGYVCVTFTMRGWFGAGGEIGCMDPNKEIRDVSNIIDLITGDERFPVLCDELGAVVGVTGYSMGGCTTFLISPRENPREGDPCDPRVRAVAPLHGGADIEFSLLPNGAAKAFWGLVLVVGSYMGNLSGFLLNTLNLLTRPDLDAWQKLNTLLGQMLKLASPISSVTPSLASLAGAALERRVADLGAEKLYLRERSIRYWCDEDYDGVAENPVTVPMLILAGWNDDIFYANEALMVISSCMAEGTPARAIITNHGHLGGMGGNFSIPLPGNNEYKWVNAEIAAWFDHFLKGEDNGADAAPRLTFYRGPGDYGSASSYPVSGTAYAPYYLGFSAWDGTLTTQAPGARTAASDLFINLGITGSVSLPYFQDATDMFGGETLQIPARLRLLSIPLTERSYISAPLEEDVTILGAPEMEAYYQCSANFTQLIPTLYEVEADGTERLVSMGFYEGYDPRTWTTLSTVDKPIEMQACYHRFKEGSRIKLEVATADLLSIWPHWGFAFIQLLRGEGQASRVMLPVVPNDNAAGSLNVN